MAISSFKDLSFGYAVGGMVTLATAMVAIKKRGEFQIKPRLKL